ncbi:MAG: hypothetical protein ACREEM_42015 [Blastocatellia bacterium]
MESAPPRPDSPRNAAIRRQIDGNETPTMPLSGVTLDAVNRRIENPIEVTNDSQEWGKIKSFVQPAFDKFEETKPTGSPGSVLHYPSNAEREKAKLVVSRLFRSKEVIGGQRIYYVEAKKEYKRPTSKTESACRAISFFKGWILQDNRGGLKLVDGRHILSDCDLKAAASSRLLGILPLRDGIFLITEDHGYEDESYAILELKGSRIKQVLNVHGGSC